MSFDSKYLHSVLKSGCEALALPLADELREKLIAYLALLHKWNAAYNLSAIREPEEMLYKHLLDSLSVVNHLALTEAKIIADIGTGAGLPGIPLALCFPEKSFILMDSAGKKIRFIKQAIHELGMTNVRAENQRVENYDANNSVDIVISRAFASISEMVRLCRHLLHDNGEFWAMKGVFPQDELSGLEKIYKVDTYSILQVPGDIGERCLLTIKKTTSEQ